MSAAGSVPLFAIEAMVIDTETTGLDPMSARVIEIAAVPVSGGQVHPDRAFSTLVACDIAIPAASRAIHGITDADLSGAPAFPDAFSSFAAHVSDAAVIGHTVGFDMAALEAACARAGVTPFAPAHVLDTRLLAQIALPTLPGFSLETLAARLEIPIENRHRALGDAILTAEIFLKLAPLLRARGIRTLGEAKAACARLDTGQMNTPWPALPAPAQTDSEKTLARIDPYAYRHRVSDVMSAPALFIAADMPVHGALGVLMEKNASSAFISLGSHNRPQDIAIVTERDILRTIARSGAQALEQPVRALMNTPVESVRAEAFVYRAVGRMNRLKIRHLAVVDDAGLIVGAVSSGDLLRLRGQAAINLGDAIDHAATTAALGQAWSALPVVARGLIDEGITARDAAAVISRELGALTRRCAQLARADIEAEHGPPLCAYAVLMLGSGGRSESLLAMDQDNAIVFDDTAANTEADRWFAALGAKMADRLDAVGVPYCKGGVMASNALWRGSFNQWRTRMEDFVRRERAQDIMNTDILFDLRAVEGDGQLAQKLREHAHTLVQPALSFLKLMAEAGAPGGSPFTLFGRVRVDEDGRVDLKRAGLFPLVTAARCLALRHGVRERGTAARFAGVAAATAGAREDLAAASHAHGVLMEAVLRQQVADVSAGLPPSNRVRLKTLPPALSRDVAQALDVAHSSGDLVRTLLF